MAAHTTPSRRDRQMTPRRPHGGARINQLGPGGLMLSAEGIDAEVGREALLIGVATPVCGTALIVTPVGTSQPSELRSQASEIGSVGALRSFRYQLWMPTVLLPRSERPKLGLSNRHRGMSVYQIEWAQRRPQDWFHMGNPG
jgi:hypothetical protein